MPAPVASKQKDTKESHGQETTTSSMCVARSSHSTYCTHPPSCHLNRIFAAFQSTWSLLWMRSSGRRQIATNVNTTRHKLGKTCCETTKLHERLLPTLVDLGPKFRCVWNPLACVRNDRVKTTSKVWTYVNRHMIDTL